MGYIVDLSEHNTVTDWAAAAKDLDAAILRIGYRGSIEGREAYKKITEDGKFRSHLAGCQKYGIPYAVYYFPTPVSDAEATEEAAWLVNRIRGLDICMPVFVDSENVQTDRSGRADKLSRKDRTRFLKIITDHLLGEGIPCGVYSYTSWLQNNVDLSAMDPQVVRNTWIAQTPKLTYKGACVIWQYGKKKFPWTTAPVDVDKIMGTFDMTVQKKEEKMEYYRQTIVEKARSFLGTKTGSAAHREILKAYNAIRPLPRGVTMTASMPWCATFVSAVGAMCGYGAVIPAECSCGFMVDAARKLGIWQERDNYVPKPGDILMYDWDDSGKGDDTGWPDHTGFVEIVDNTSFTTIEGNSGSGNGEVRRVKVQVNQKNIRGFITPRYTKDAPVKEPEVKTAQLTIELPEIHLGDKGEHVRLWQWLIGIEETGIYDEATQAETRKWQKANGKKVDGWIGKGCWTKAMQVKGWE